ncbi:MAG: hypothetical protein GY720_02495 [bacterium]|nr:hypothetical protein [bacterium]
MRREQGAAAIVMLALAFVAVLVALLVADVSVYLGARARAQVAADAAALAAAPVTFRSFGSSGSATDEAREFAARNGGSLVDCRCGHDASWRPREVTVLVELPVDLVVLGSTVVQARSSAEFVPTDLAE